ncbi:hypothetical protein [Nocardiopsis trehalosi]|jgi:hypothetical protein|uniref:hypothetical protein n=1 Tax=Nocardiopsis trehalosi TaxID=109329 RepID=UPI0008319618|nr:hypothetical protein [Nocardiopsis trehalosi]
MPSWILAGAVLIIACGVFVIWRLVQLTKQPRTYFRGGNADPQRHHIETDRPGPLAPETVKEPTRRNIFETTVDEQAALLIQGERHEKTPITTNLDREVRRAVEEEVRGEPLAEGNEVEVRTPTPPDDFPPDVKGGVAGGPEHHRKAAEQHRQAAEQYEKAAESEMPVSRDESRRPADENADGSPRRG